MTMRRAVSNAVQFSLSDRAVCEGFATIDFVLGS